MREDVTQIRRSLSGIVGSKVMLETNKGRQKAAVSSGTIENTYPAVFTVLLDAVSGPKRTVSYSYTDILTKNVEITVFNN